MARWTRDEIEQAFEHYQAVALEAGISGDWNAWADQFTGHVIDYGTEPDQKLPLGSHFTLREIRRTLGLAQLAG